MLRSLEIHNIATVEKLAMEFAPGLNVLTGETGAGKSVLIEGLSLALGERASAESIREGAAGAAVEAVFGGPFPADLKPLLVDELSVEWDGAEELAVRREIGRGGKNRCFVNGQMVGVAELARAGERLVDFHGQHEHQSLLRKGAARDALDAFADHPRLLAEYAAAWIERGALERRRDELAAAARDFDQRADYLDFQLAELDKLAPRAGELAELEREEKRLAAAESLSQAAAEGYAILYDGPADDTPALLATLGEVRRRVAQLAALEPGFVSHLSAIEGQKSALEDLAFALRDYAETAQSDPDRLNAAIERSEAIRRLARKHGGSEEALQKSWEAMRGERERMSLDRDEREKIEGSLALVQARLGEAAAKLTRSRRRVADRFAKQVAAELKQLNMDQAAFEIAIAPLAEAQSRGADDIEFLLAANPGLPAAPLRKTGSGGELSRVMLALKSTLAARDAIGSLVFDEIDAGVSGQTAVRVAETLDRLAKTHQIICITHLAPIAAKARRHFAVAKESRGGATFTRVAALENDARLEELARIMGGDGGRRSARALARELLDAPQT